MRDKLIASLIAAAVCVSSAALAEDRASQQFMKKAMEGNLAEVEMGKLAQEKAASDGVRSFGQMLEQDHSEANQKAAEAAKTLGITAPTAPNSKQKADYDRLSKLSGARFDREFVKYMVSDHKKDIKEYEQEAKKHDAASTYASDALPTLEKHLKTAQSLSGGTSKTGRR